MKVRTENGLVYDCAHPKCRLHLSRTQGKGFAFIQCLDTGLDGKAERVKRYWGAYADSLDNRENGESIYHIMRTGSPWPDLPQ
ncbi:hypothetical protein AT251_20965 [Enterovibrio nigricans]|uniref:Uncharacterized protein n=2 Tax=Enterovibrio nigricans TaxID=504469 RepID=A0A1T4VZ05_9GAMM|nr:hypothetical protein AT251_20965 [Enterovibrio nigricans]SKA70250.1 hypothetical protein SAMN02745132_04560 [Enterovibrio nigricans DSM 22720]